MPSAALLRAAARGSTFVRAAPLRAAQPMLARAAVASFSTSPARRSEHEETFEEFSAR